MDFEKKKKKKVIISSPKVLQVSPKFHQASHGETGREKWKSLASGSQILILVRDSVELCSKRDDVTRLRAACTDTYGQYLAIESASEQRGMSWGWSRGQFKRAGVLHAILIADNWSTSIVCHGLNKGRTNAVVLLRVEDWCSLFLERDWLTLRYSIYREKSQNK